MGDTLGERLTEARTAAKLSQTQVAKRIGVQGQSISGYESGYRQPSFDVLIQLARLYQVTTDYLLGLDKKHVIDASGLTEEERYAFSGLISDLAEKNARLEKMKK